MLTTVSINGRAEIVPRRGLRIAYIVRAFPHISETFIVNEIVGIAVRGHTVDICGHAARWDRLRGGLGMLGQLLVQILRAAGVYVIGVD